MKHVLFFLTGICMVFGIGLAGANLTPNLTGNWEVTELHCISYSGEIDTGVSGDDRWILSQDDTFITGRSFFTIGDTIVEESLAGIISPEGNMVHIVDKSGGTYIVSITGEDTLTVTYLNTGDTKEEKGYAMALSEKLQRV